MRSSTSDRTVQAPSLVPIPIAVESSTLRVTAGPHLGKELPLDKEMIIIGRAEWCDLVLDKDPKVSSKHCQIMLEEHGARILDHRSSNGTLLAGQQIFEAYLKPGVPLVIGDTTLELVVDAETKKQIIPQYQDDSGKLVGKSAQMRRLFHWMTRIGPRDASVLLTGETGTGKTRIAQAIHELSGRKGRFVEVNCGALSANLIEGLLFGYKKGAFTGATHAHDGFLLQADGGTLFLDEIGELPMELQPNLLQVIESHTFRPLGGSEDVCSNFRLITATHRNLPEAIEEGLFRQDLYFRLNVIKLEVPPLRERPEDIPLLCASVLQQLPEAEHIEITPDALRKLQRYVWPGNVRELRSILERCVVLLESRTIDVDDLFFDFDDEANQFLYHTIHPPTPPGPTDAPTTDTTNAETQLDAGTRSLLLEQAMTALVHQLKDDTLEAYIDRMEAFFLQHTLDRMGSVQEAARHLGVSRGLIYKRIHKYALDVP